LKESITSALKDGNLSCVAAWEIAKKLNIPKMKVCAAAEALEIKVKPCQLGAF
jgi:PIN domain nuclease of toxin-antitoxin system